MAKRRRGRVRESIDRPVAVGVPAEEVVQIVRQECGPRILLAFSRGKDSIAAWLAIRDRFEEVVPVFFYAVPGLSFVEESLSYFEEKMGRRIIRLPHPSFYRQLATGLFQVPERVPVIFASGLPDWSRDYTFQAAFDFVREEQGLEPHVLAASGVRAADSPARRLAMSTHGPISWRSGHFYPVWDWNKARLVEELRRADIALPEEYRWFGRTWDGLDLRFLLPMKQHRPDDYRRVLDWFPLAEVEVWRHERAA